MSSWSARGTAFKASGVIFLPIDFEGEVVDVVPRVAHILATKMILGKAFIDKFIKSIEPERRHIISETGRQLPILVSITDATTTHIGLEKAKRDKDEVKCAVAKITTILPRSKPVLTMTTK